MRRPDAHVWMPGFGRTTWCTGLVHGFWGDCSTFAPCEAIATAARSWSLRRPLTNRLRSLVGGEARSQTWSLLAPGVLPRTPPVARSARGSVADWVAGGVLAGLVPLSEPDQIGPRCPLRVELETDGGVAVGPPVPPLSPVPFTWHPLIWSLRRTGERFETSDARPLGERNQSMRDIEVILDFLEKHGLLRPPDRMDEDPRGDIPDGENESVYQVDWPTVTASSEPDRATDELDDWIDDWPADGPLRELGAAEERRSFEPEAHPVSPEIWEKCAWYQPMQTFGPAWGIYIRQDCLLTIAAEIGAFAWDSPRTWRTAHHLVKAAFFALFLHEHFHHKVEGFGIRLALADRATPDHWHRYKTAVYRPSLWSDDNLEEALASADAYHRLIGSPYRKVLPEHIRSATRRWMKWRFDQVDPPGYRMARHYLTQDSFRAGAELLQSQILEASLTPKSNPEHWQAGPHMLRSIYPITSDIYLIIPAGRAPVLPVSATRPRGWYP